MNPIEQLEHLARMAQQQQQPYQPAGGEYSAAAVSDYVNAVANASSTSGPGSAPGVATDALGSSSTPAAVAAAALKAQPPPSATKTDTVASESEALAKPEALAGKVAATNAGGDVGGTQSNNGQKQSHKANDATNNASGHDDDPMTLVVDDHDSNGVKAPLKEAPPSSPAPAPSAAASKKAAANGKSTPSRTTPTKSRKKSAGASSATKKKKTKSTKESSGSSSKGRDGSAAANAVAAAATGPKRFPLPDGTFPTMDDPMDPITDIEYENLDTLMERFCRVPLLAEFSRPVAVLHPELVETYSKIVHHPIDMGRVCRRIRRRQYKNLREVRMDFWRVFANCVRYHSHYHNKNAVPSFVSIALHLRDYFNDLWQEFMIPSDAPGHRTPTPGSALAKAPGSSIDKDAILRSEIEQRTEDRKKRLVVAGLSVMAGRYLERAGTKLKQLIKDGGRVDKLDSRPIWGEGVDLDDEDEADLQIVLDNLRKLETTLREVVSHQEELGVDELEKAVRDTYSSEAKGLENMRPTLRMQIAARLDRYMGQLIVPIHEATCRGVSQSSIWGCMAAGVWARESSKKPFWPALVLGMIAPEDQREAWHQALTERNEERLPEKLKTQLVNGKRNAEKQIKKQSQGQAEPQSFFLVEFLGTHEFIWVREADIVESFNADEDPNKNDNVGANKKKRVSKSHLTHILNSKTYANAIDEITWALDEFELQLQDVEGEPDEKGEGYADTGYTYDVLAQSDDEGGTADDDDPDDEKVDIDECNELLETNGLLDLSAAGKKRREQRRRRQKALEEKNKKAQKARKEKAAKAKKEKEQKIKAKELKIKAKEKEKEKKINQREVERKRRKRIREREKALLIRDIALKDYAPGKRHTIPNKRARAEAIVNGYLLRDHTGLKQYKPLGLGKGANNILTIPAALVDSTNLIGMALAFRAASGDIPMPEESSVHLTKAYKDTWNSISLKGKKTSADRSAALKRQIEILEDEIVRSRASKKRRLELVDETKDKVVEIEKKVATDDGYARVNPLLKFKKTYNPSAGRKRKKSVDTTASNDGDEGAEAVTAGNKDDTGDELETDSEAPDFDVPDAEPAEIEAEAEVLEEDEDSAADADQDESVGDAMEAEAASVTDD